MRTKYLRFSFFVIATFYLTIATLSSISQRKFISGSCNLNLSQLQLVSHNLQQMQLYISQLRYCITKIGKLNMTSLNCNFISHNCNIYLNKRNFLTHNCDIISDNCNNCDKSLTTATLFLIIATTATFSQLRLFILWQFYLTIANCSLNYDILSHKFNLRSYNWHFISHSMTLYCISHLIV